MKRRRFIQLIAASSVTGACTSDMAGTGAIGGKMAPTRAQTEGPFYPYEPIEESNNLILSGHKGSKLELSGTVYNTDGDPLPGARVEIWQCDAEGVYKHPRQRGVERFDPLFKGFGAFIADNTGYYQFTTIVPVPYAWRPPHIHTKVFIDSEEKLTSQIYLASERGNAKLKMALQSTGNETYRAVFDFVIKA